MCMRVCVCVYARACVRGTCMQALRGGGVGVTPTLQICPRSCRPRPQPPVWPLTPKFDRATQAFPKIDMRYRA